MKLVLRSILLVCVMSFCSGCITKSKVDKLVTLKKFESVQKATEDLVDDEVEHFKRIMDVYKSGKIMNYSDQNAIFETFAEPIRIKPVTRNGQNFESWLYRDPVEPFESEKLFLYFDDNGVLMDTEYWEKP